jgi:hypothetical protein
MSLTIGCGLLSGVVLVCVFGVATVVSDDDGLSTIGLVTVTIFADFDKSVTTGVPPEMMAFKNCYE